MKCEALKHEKQCNRIGNTRDHFTPRSIAKAMGIKAKVYNAAENIQYLSEPCHKKKDEITPTEANCNRLRGGMKTLWEHHNELIILRKGMPEEAKLKVA